MTHSFCLLSSLVLSETEFFNTCSCQKSVLLREFQISHFVYTLNIIRFKYGMVSWYCILCFLLHVTQYIAYIIEFSRNAFFFTYINHFIYLLVCMWMNEVLNQ